MSILEKNIQTLQEQIHSVNFDISKSFISDSEVVKNIIISKNPIMSKADAEIMVDGAISAVTEASMKLSSNIVSTATSTAQSLTTLPTDISLPPLPTLPPLSSLTPTSILNSKKTTLEIKKDTAEFARKKKIFPLPKNHPIFQEAKNMKKEVRKSVMMMIKEQKAIMQDLIKTAIQMTNSISGAAVLIAPLSFNVPGAISLILLVIDSISKLINKMMDVILHMEPLKYLPMLLPKESFESITAPINIALTILISIFGAISGLKKLIDKLMGSIKSKVDPNNMGSTIKSLKKQLSDRTAELMKLKTDGSPSKDIDDKQIEVNELQSRLDGMIKGYNLPDSKNGEFPETSVKDTLDMMDPSISQQINTITTANVELVEYIYDVYLEDGTVVANLNENDLEIIKQKYKVIFDNELSQ